MWKFSHVFGYDWELRRSGLTVVNMSFSSSLQLYFYLFFLLLYIVMVTVLYTFLFISYRFLDNMIPFKLGLLWLHLTQRFSPITDKPSTYTIIFIYWLRFNLTWTYIQLPRLIDLASSLISNMRYTYDLQLFITNFFNLFLILSVFYHLFVLKKTLCGRNVYF